MRKDLLNKTLVMCVFILLIGVSVAGSSPIISVCKSQMSTFESSEYKSISLVNNELLVIVETDKEKYDIGEPVKIEIFVSNIGMEPITLIFPTIQTADFRVNGGSVYTWSTGKIFPQILTPVTIPSWQTIKIFSENWEQVDYDGNQVPEGDYWIEGWVVNSLNYPPIFGEPVIISIENDPPLSPTITGPDCGRPRQELTYIFNILDPDGEDWRFHIDWGNGNSEWTDYVPSGTDKPVSHTWSRIGRYLITAFAQDYTGKNSTSVTKQVTIPRNKPLNFKFNDGPYENSDCFVIGWSGTTSTRKIVTAIANINDGSLLGYVTDTSGSPIEGALVRVHFHENYEEDNSDSNGFYHVTNIPICYCLKNATCSKEGYKTEWVLLSITENTTHDFVLNSENQPPEAPIINGPTGGNPGDILTFTFSALDPDDDDVRFHIDWGDGNTDTTTYVASGDDKTVSHAWIEDGSYLLTVYAEDEYGATGPESTFCFVYVGTVVIITHVTELYGTPDDPQYRPLAEVTVKIKRVPFFWNYWRGLTDETGTTEKVKVGHGVSYKVIVTKNNYLVYGGPPYSIVGSVIPYTHHANFTMVKDDSPFLYKILNQGRHCKVICDCILQNLEKSFLLHHLFNIRKFC